MARHEKYLAMVQMLKKIPGVIDVGLGCKETNGVFTREISYVVIVREKIKEEELLPEHIIPKEMNGIKTDVVKIPTLVNQIRPIRGGVKLDSDECKGTGTLGCIATHPTFGRVCLTNHHVLYNQFYDNTPSPVERDTKVGQPNISCSWCCQCNVIGHIKDSRRRNNESVDCGIVKIDDKISSINEIAGAIPIRGVAPVRPDPGGSGVMYHVFPEDIVKIVGEKTNTLTLGVVKQINFSANITEEDKTTVTTLTDQIVIIHKDGANKRFTYRGDSGAIILDANNMVIGLHCVGTPELDSHGNTTPPPYISVSNNIHNVITAMNITINVTTSAGGGSSSSDIFTGDSRTVDDSEEENTTYQVYLDKYRKILEETNEGRAILKSIQDNAKEVRELVYHNRHVIVAWQRNQGPAFVASVIKRLKDNNEEILKEVNGVNIHILLEAMVFSLIKNGSDQLRYVVRKYAERILPVIDRCRTYEDLILHINKVSHSVQTN